jgi:hypothetical protein
MTKFKILRFVWLPNAAHSRFCARVSIELAAAGEAVINALGTLPAEFESWHSRENALMDWVRRDALTQRIAEANRNMNRVLMGMVSQVRALRRSARPDVVAAAGRMFIMYREYGYVYRKPYEAQGGDVDSILRQLAGAYAADVALLDLGTWAGELQDAYAQFRQLLAQRDMHSLLKPEEGFPAVRRGIEGVYRRIVAIVDAGAVLGQSPDFALFIDKLNPDIDRLNAEFHRVRHRIARAEPAPIPPQAFTGQPVTPSPDVYCVVPHAADAVRLLPGRDYYLSYKNNTHPGNATCIIHGRGAFRGRKTITFVIIEN